MKVVSEALTFFVSFFVLRQKMKSFHDSHQEGKRISSAQAAWAFTFLWRKKSKQKDAMRRLLLLFNHPLRNA